MLLCWQLDSAVTAVVLASGYVIKLTDISAVVISVGSQNYETALHAPHCNDVL